MEREKNLYMYVYRMLLTAIYNGTYRYQEKLPILTTLCVQYDVGRNTVRSALSKLQNDGYVTLQKGVQATVIFDVSDLNNNLQFRQALMDARDMTKDVYLTMGKILPNLFIACLEEATIDIETMKELVNEFQIENIHNETELIQKMYEMYLYVFHAMGNPILVDLVFTLLSYSYQPISPKEQSFANLKRSVNGIHRATTIFIALVQRKQYEIGKKMVELMVNLHGKSSMRNIDSLCKNLEPKNQIGFVWVCNRGHEYLYAMVVLDILVGIADQSYRVGDFLPSISDISSKYEVSDRTTRKALDVLRSVFVIETVNGLGSKIVKHHFEPDAQILQDEKVRENLMAYLHSLPIFRVILQTIMSDALKKVTKEELGSIADEMIKTNNKTIARLGDLLFSKENACLNTLFQELKKTLVWCAFANMFVEDDDDVRLREELIDAMYQKDETKMQRICQEILRIDERRIKEILKV